MIAPALVAAWWLVSFSPAAPFPADPRVSDVASLDAEPAVHERTEQRVKPKLVTPALVSAAEELLNLPMGAEQYETINGTRYVFVLERHYHPPGFVGAPNGWHKGVTVYRVE